MTTPISIPHNENFCGGNFQDWLEVYLIGRCNGVCSWCVDKNGYRPKEEAHWEVIAEQAHKVGRTNVILLGGEPTLYKHIQPLIKRLVNLEHKVWITTNGGMLTRDFIFHELDGITGINISIHHYDLKKNAEITGIRLRSLEYLTECLALIGANIRFNCNCITGYIDSEEKIRTYVRYAKSYGADKVRFAELKDDDDNFVNLGKILDYKYGLNEDPFTLGCNKNAYIEGLSVNFRQMCGFQTRQRKLHKNPLECYKPVLYYDGIVYDGWQEGNNMTKKRRTIDTVLKDLNTNKITVAHAKAEIKQLLNQALGSETLIGDVMNDDGDGFARCKY